MRTRDDIWICEEDRWGIDRFAWEEEEDSSPPQDEQPETTREDPRY
jgi:hypothetical protein